MKVNDINQEEVWNEIAVFWNKFREKKLFEVEEFLKNKTGKILDLGCGTGRNFVKNSNIEYYGVDFSGKMLEFAEKKIEKEGINGVLFKNPAESLPFKDNFFDAAICISLLHCIKTQESRQKALKELYRVMKFGAELMITTWTKNQSKKLVNFDKEGYVGWKSGGKNYQRYTYLYDKNELEELLKKIGFKIVKSQDWITKGKFPKKNIIFYCKK